MIIYKNILEILKYRFYPISELELRYHFADFDPRDFEDALIELIMTNELNFYRKNSYDPVYFSLAYKRNID